MKYLLQIYPGAATESFERLSADEQQAIVRRDLVLRRRPGLSAASYCSRPIRRPRSGSTTTDAITDGPFPDAKAHLGGFSLLEVDDLDAALELAARVPVARMGGAVEVRPLVER